jgi:hypothetical protein
MKTIKISLAVIVVVAIAFFVWKSKDEGQEPQPISESQNEFIPQIEQKINSISSLPNNEFNKEVYQEVLFEINEFSRPNPPQYPYGRLGKTQAQNDLMKNNLTRDLYTAYTQKFLAQAFYVFRNKDWKPEDLNFIRREYRRLQQSPLLQRGSVVDNKFNEIQGVFNKYDEISNFLASCYSFDYPGTNKSIMNDRFPLERVQNKLNEAKSYLNNNMENPYLKNNPNLRNELNKIPEALFRKHVKYLEEKINSSLGLYTKDFAGSHSNYSRSVYTPLINELNVLTRDIYKTTDYYSEYLRLRNKLYKDASDAWEYWDKRN